MKKRKSETGGETGVPRARARGGEATVHMYVGAPSIHLIQPHYLQVCCKIGSGLVSWLRRHIWDGM